MRYHMLPVVLLAVSIAAMGLGSAASGQSPDLSGLALEPTQHLMFVSYMGRSHMMPYLEILHPLADRGHKVTIVTDIQAEKWLKPNYPKFNIRLVPADVWDEAQSLMPHIMAQMLKPKTTQTGFANMLKYITVPTYKPLVDNFKVVFTEDKPDLLLCDYLSMVCSDVADTLELRHGVTISSLPPGISDAPYINGWSSAVLSATTVNMSLYQRLYNKFIIPINILRAMGPQLKKLQQIKDEIGIVTPPGPPPQRYARALKVTNSFIGFEAARPIDPLVQLVGPIRSNVNSTMTPELQEWIDNLNSSSSSTGSSSKRVIYVAFGTHVDPPAHLVTSLMTALVTTIDQGLADGVIWAVSNIKRDKFPSDVDPRVLLLPFAPQKAVLSSPDVCLFVSHGGAESAHEAMYEGKPLLVVPFYGDQPMNAAKMTEAGYANFISHHDVTPLAVQAKLFKMLNPHPDPQNPDAPYAGSYAAAAQRQQALVRTLSKHNTAAAGEMLLFFARYGWDHLIPASTKMPWHKATDADIYVVVALAVLFVFACILYGFQLAWAAVLRGLGYKRKAKQC